MGLVLENLNLPRWGSGGMIEGRGEDETGLTGEGEGEKMEERTQRDTDLPSFPIRRHRF